MKIATTYLINCMQAAQLCTEAEAVGLVNKALPFMPRLMLRWPPVLPDPKLVLKLLLRNGCAAWLL